MTFRMWMISLSVWATWKNTEEWSKRTLRTGAIITKQKSVSQFRRPSRVWSCISCVFAEEEWKMIYIHANANITGLMKNIYFWSSLDPRSFSYTNHNPAFVSIKSSVANDILLLVFWPIYLYCVLSMNSLISVRGFQMQVLVSSRRKYRGTLRKPCATTLSLCPHHCTSFTPLSNTEKWISHRGLISTAFSGYLSGKRAWSLDSFWLLLYNIFYNTHYRLPKRREMHNTLTQFTSLKCNTFYRSVLR